MNTTDLRLGDLPADQELDAQALERVSGGRTQMNLGSSPLEDKYRPDPVSVWVREVVEDVEAY